MSDLARLRGMQAENRRTVELLQSLEPVRLEDVSDRDKQLATALKLRDLLSRIEPLLNEVTPKIAHSPAAKEAE